MPPRTETDPIDLDKLEALGAVRFGRAVARVVLVYADGGRVSMDLPPPTGSAGYDGGLSDMAEDVLAVLGRLRPGDRMLVRSLAAEVDSDDQGGHFRRTLAELRKRKLIERQAGRVWLTEQAEGN